MIPRPHVPSPLAQDAVEHRALSRGRPVCVLSDMHLGPVGPRSFPIALEEVASKLVDEAHARGGLVVLNGDIFDVDLSLESPRRIMAIYPQLSASLERCHREGALFFLRGNHDHRGDQVARSLSWVVGDRLIVDDRILILHGHQFDRYIGSADPSTFDRVRVFAEQFFDARIQFPFVEHPNLVNRVFQSAACCWFELLRYTLRLSPPHAEQLEGFLTYLVRQELCLDPCELLHGLREAALPSQFEVVVCGHSHLPGLARVDGHLYANSGTWSDHHAGCVWIEPSGVRVRDLRRNSEYGFEAYANWERPIDWQTWWSFHAGHVRPHVAMKELLLALSARANGRTRS